MAALPSGVFYAWVWMARCERPCGKGCEYLGAFGWHVSYFHQND